MTLRSFAASLVGGAVLLGCAGIVQAADWGNLKGQFIYKGTAPTPTKLNITKDVDVCTKPNPVDESILVGSNGGIKNVVVYLVPARGKKVEVHPDYAATAGDNVTLDNKNCRFEPHVGLVRTSQTLLLKNSDSVGHNSKIDAFINPQVNVMIPAGGQVEQKLTLEEKMPVQVSCSIHPWMTSFVVVRDDPYMAVTGDDGTFEIKNLPAGEHEFAFWHEKAGWVKNVKFTSGKTDRKGRAELKIKAGDNDLGKVELSPTAFK